MRLGLTAYIMYTMWFGCSKMKSQWPIVGSWHTYTFPKIHQLTKYDHPKWKYDPNTILACIHTISFGDHIDLFWGHEAASSNFTGWSGFISPDFTVWNTTRTLKTIRQRTVNWNQIDLNFWNWNVAGYCIETCDLTGISFVHASYSLQNMCTVRI